MTDSSKTPEHALSGARLLLVDDDMGMLQMLDEWFSMFGCLVQRATSGMQALSLLKQQSFEVILTDLHMPGLDGLQLLSILKERDPDVQVVFLSGQATMEDTITALREGRAFDFLVKPVRDFKQLNTVIARALERRRRLPQTKAAPSVPPHVEPLSPRELELVALLAEGRDNREIADRLVISEKTVKNHLTRIYEKLKVSNRTQAVLACQAYGLLPAPEQS